jgi:hypothetical protein
MLNPQADRKGLGFQDNAASRKHGVRIIGALPRGKNQVAGFDFFRIVDHNPFQTTMMKPNTAEATLKAEFATQVREFPSQIDHDLSQVVRPDMGLGVG